MGLALRAWLGDCLLQFGEPRPWTKVERSGVSIRGLGCSVLVLWVRQPEVRVQMWKPRPLSPVVQQLGVRPSYRTLGWDPEGTRLLSTDAPAGAGQPGSRAPQQGQASHQGPQWVCHSRVQCCPSKECPGLLWGVRRWC